MEDFLLDIICAEEPTPVTAHTAHWMLTGAGLVPVHL
jgi:hypothetical protein